MFNTTVPAVDFAAFAAPVQKLVELNTATFTKAFEAQKAVAEKQANLAQARAKAAMEIKDVEGLTAFVKEQTELAQSSFAEMTEASKAAAEEVKAYFAEVQAILSQTQEVVAKAAPVAKPAAKQAA